MRYGMAASLGLSTLLLAPGAFAQAVGGFGPTFAGGSFQSPVAPVAPGGFGGGFGIRGAINPAPSGGLSTPGTPLTAPGVTPGSAFGPSLGIFGTGGTTLISPNDLAGRTTSAFGTPASNMVGPGGAFGGGFGAPGTTTTPLSVLAVPGGGIASPSAILQSMGLLGGGAGFARGAAGQAPIGAFPVQGSVLGGAGILGGTVGAFGAPGTVLGGPTNNLAIGGGFIAPGGSVGERGSFFSGQAGSIGRPNGEDDGFAKGDVRQMDAGGMSVGLRGSGGRSGRERRGGGDGWQHMRSLY